MNSSLIAIVAVIMAIILFVIICDVRETRRLKKEKEAETRRLKKEEEAEERASCGNADTYGYHNPIEDVGIPVCCCFSCRVYGGYC